MTCHPCHCDILLLKTATGFRKSDSSCRPCELRKLSELSTSDTCVTGVRLSPCRLRPVLSPFKHGHEVSKQCEIGSKLFNTVSKLLSESYSCMIDYIGVSLEGGQGESYPLAVTAMELSLNSRRPGCDTESEVARLVDVFNTAIYLYNKYRPLIV